ncbi:MAG: sigma-70 family RNA polymerase sigma factor [Patescibacteria group bacterium]|nr:sigma-70 family RNA polymerase sigma factor [Patescibacteria group bacterium]
MIGAKNKILGLYLNETKKFKKLTEDVEIELGRQFKVEHNIDAYKKLINHNLWLVVMISYRFIGTTELLDLIQAGTEGLLNATKRFDYRFNNRLSKYASPWIEQSIKNEIMYNNKDFPMRVPVNVQMMYGNLNKSIRYFKNKYQREPEWHEIIDEMGLIEDKVNPIFFKFKNVFNPISLDSPIRYKKNERGNRKAREKSEVIGKDVFTAEQLLEIKDELSRIIKKILRKSKARFSKKSYEIFCEFCGFNKDFKIKSPTEIARKYSCTRSNVYEVTKEIFLISYLIIKGRGYQVEKNKIKGWLKEMLKQCAWIQETTGSKVINFNDFK